MVSRISSAAAFSLLCASFATGAVSQSGSGSAELPVVLTRSGYHVDVQVGGRPFATYSFDPSVAKPYWSPLRSARGIVVTRGFPMTSADAGEDHDEPHQRAMYFAHGDINGFDFWGEAAFPKWSDHGASTFGRTVFRTLDEIHDGADGGNLRATFDLVVPAGVIAEETQTYRFGGDELGFRSQQAARRDATNSRGPSTVNLRFMPPMAPS